jgi:hypothetical protein
MKKFTFMLANYVDYQPSDSDYLYDEDRYWELKFIVIANNNSEALENLSKGNERKIINENSVEITETFMNYDYEEPFLDEETNTYQIVSEKDAIFGIDFVEPNISLLNYTKTEKDWSDGKSTKCIYTFSDGISIIKTNNSAPGWYESETCITNNNTSIIIHSHGEDIYNKGDKNIYSIQKIRLNLISDFHEKERLKRSIHLKSVANATSASRNTFLDREMPYLVA